MAVSVRGLGVCENCELVAVGGSPQIHSNLTATSLQSTHKGIHPEVKEDVATLTGVLNLRVHAGMSMESSNQAVEMTLPCRKIPRARLVVPIAWRVSPRIEVVPNRIFLGSAERGSTVSRRVVVRANDGAFSGEVLVENRTGAALERVTKVTNDENMTIIEIVVRYPDRSGPWRESLAVWVDGRGGEPVLLPISGISTGM